MVLKLKQRSPRRQTILAVVGILLFAAIGAYAVLSTQASSQVKLMRDTVNGPSSLAFPSRIVTQDIGNGVYKSTFYANIPNPPAGDLGDYVVSDPDPQGRMNIRLYFKDVDYTDRHNIPDRHTTDPTYGLRVLCGLAGTCHKDLSDTVGYDSRGWYGGEYKGVQRVCIDIPKSLYGKADQYVVALQFKPRVANEYGLKYDFKYRDGPCASSTDDDDVGIEGDGDVYGTGADGIGPGEAGPDGSTPGRGGNNGLTSGSGGGGGATAKKQNDTPNSIPSSAARGESDDQPELEPSPFYDGKQYDKGSDSDSFAGTARSTGKKLLSNWYFVLGAAVIGGIAGWVLWWWRRK